MLDNQSTPNDPIPSELVQEDQDFADLVEDYLRSMPERVQQIEEAINSTDFETLRRYAHQLKGSGGGHGYPMLTETAAQLEQQAIAQQLDACERNLAALKSLISRLVVRTND